MKTHRKSYGNQASLLHNFPRYIHQVSRAQDRLSVHHLNILRPP